MDKVRCMLYSYHLKFFMSFLKQDAEWYDRNTSGGLSSRLPAHLLESYFPP